MTLRKIISGGQTGADLGGLLGAQLAGVATGGTAPKGWRTEDGPAEALLRSFGLRESPSPQYPARTRANVTASDATLIVGSIQSPGSRLTRNICDELRRPFFHYEWPKDSTWVGDSQSVSDLARWVLTHEVRVLNVAGNRESKSPGIADATARLVLKLCGVVNR